MTPAQRLTGWPALCWPLLDLVPGCGLDSAVLPVSLGLGTSITQHVLLMMGRKSTMVGGRRMGTLQSTLFPSDETRLMARSNIGRQGDRYTHDDGGEGGKERL